MISSISPLLSTPPLISVFPSFLSFSTPPFVSILFSLPLISLLAHFPSHIMLPYDIIGYEMILYIMIWHACQPSIWGITQRMKQLRRLRSLVTEFTFLDLLMKQWYSRTQWRITQVQRGKNITANNTLTYHHRPCFSPYPYPSRLSPSPYPQQWRRMSPWIGPHQTSVYNSVVSRSDY